jgi:hypothetical protein
MDDIVTAKDELYNKLRNYSEVVGASVRGRNSNQHIVILLSKFTRNIRLRIPDSFKGNRVTHEVIGKITSSS